MEDCKIGSVHASISFIEYSRQDYDYRIYPNFRLELTKDLKFMMFDAEEKADSGTYTQTSDSLILIKGKANWLAFKWNKSHPDTLNLFGNRLMFYDTNQDTLFIFNGYDVNFRFIKSKK